MIERVRVRHGASGRLVATIVIVCEQVLVSEQPAWPFGTTSLALATVRNT